MTIKDHSYYAPAGEKRITFNVQGSKFIASLFPLFSEDEAKEALNSVGMEYPDATHHTYAYRIGSGSTLIERSSDDREPAGTAGSPMLQLMQGKNVSDLLIVGSRYFGGTKLGIGGLTRAYRDCARLVLEEAKLVLKEPQKTFQLEIIYSDLGAVSRLAESLGATIAGIDYSDKVIIHLTLPARESENLLKGFDSATRGAGNIVDTASPKQI